METKPSNYFEGTLQLRDVSDEVIEFAVNEIEKDEGSHIAKIIHVKNGVDICISRQRFLRSLGSKLQKRFGGQIVVSTRLHTRSSLTSRDLYRVNMLFRIPKFKKGDIIDHKGSKIKIVSMHKKVFAKDIQTGKKLNLSFKDLIG